MSPLRPSVVLARGEETVAAYVEDAVEASPVVFKGNLPGKLQQLFLRELFAQTGIEIFGDIGRSHGHCISQLDDQTLQIGENGEVPVRKSAQFFVAQARFSAHGRINVYSERAADARGGADFGQLDVTERDSTLFGQACLHGDAAPNEAWHAHLKFHRGEVLAEHFAHDSVKPTQLPGRLLLFQT